MTKDIERSVSDMISINNLFTTCEANWNQFIFFLKNLSHLSTQDLPQANQHLPIQHFLEFCRKFIAFEDNHILVILKPPGVLSQQDKSGHPSVLEIFSLYLRFAYHKPGKVFLAPVHRLDRPTSGLMLLARTSKAAARLSDQMRERRIGKTYLAATSRKNSKLADQGSLNGHHFKKSHGRAGKGKIFTALTSGSLSKDNEGHIASLDYQLIQPHNQGYLWQVQIHGGKFHQIRSLFSAHGMPLIGDIKYGGSKLDHNFHMIALMASRLSFLHPTRDEEIVIGLNQFAPWAEEEFFSFFRENY